MGNLSLRCLILVLLAAGILIAGEHRGVVKLGTLPVPGATVTARQGDKTVTVLTDLQGAYVFPDLADGTWTIKVEMRGFAPVEREVQSPGTAEWNLAILPLAKITEARAERGGARGRVSESRRSSIPPKVAAARRHQHHVRDFSAPKSARRTLRWLRRKFPRTFPGAPPTASWSTEA